MDRWKFLEHTADIFVEINGQTISDLFLNATACFADLLAPHDLLAVSEETWEARWSFDGENYEDLLMSWLKEMLYLSRAEEVVVTSFELHVLTSKTIEATVRGKKTSGDDEWLEAAESEIKAVTYHNFRIEERLDGFTAWVVFDV